MKKSRTKKGKSNELKLEIDTGLYPREAVEAAGRAFSDRVDVSIARGGNGTVVAVLKSGKNGSSEQAGLEGEFYNELLHQAMRFDVSKNNQTIREYVVTKVLLSAQQPSAPPPSPEPVCPECNSAEEAAPGKADPELEAEIEKLLAQIEAGGPGEDPLGVAVAWEEKYGAKGGSHPKGGKK